MTKVTKIAGGAFATLLVLFALATVDRALKKDSQPAPAASSAITPVPTVTPSPARTPSPPITPKTAAGPGDQGFLYGRITLGSGDVYEGRLRWGRSEEAFWGDYFNGAKEKNAWAALVPLERLPKERSSTKILGIEIDRRERLVNLGRLFMARFGDIARIEGRGRDVRVTLKSGTVFDLDRFSASDFDDDLRVWDAGGVMDFDSRQIRTVELLPTAAFESAPDRLQGTVHTKQGDFTGFIQWNRAACVGTDELDGHASDGELSLRFDTIRSIARQSRGRSFVTLRDGREIVLSGVHEVGDGNRRGIYVDDRRYGRVLISWDAFERVDFSPGASGPAYEDFPPGHPLTGSVTTRDGRRLAGRLVYDLDESETTETLDAPSQGIDYTIPFGLVGSIVPPGRDEQDAQHGSVTLHNGQELKLERSGDLGDGNAGTLVFVDGREPPEYVPWADVRQITFDRPPSMYPPLDGR